MSIARAIRDTSLAAVASGLVSGGLSAQTPDALRGRVVDTEGEAVRGQAVALHRVTRAGGAAVARATTDDGGEFTLALPATAGDAVLFVATRFDDRLYIGPTFRGGDRAPVDYRIVVGGEGIASRLGMAAAPAAGVGPPSAGTEDGRRWWIGGGAALAAALLLALGRRVQSRPPESRRLLRDLARLEERRAAVDAGNAAAEAAYRRERAALRSRLKEIARA